MGANGASRMFSLPLGSHRGEGWGLEGLNLSQGGLFFLIFSSEIRMWEIFPKGPLFYIFFR